MNLTDLLKLPVSLLHRVWRLLRVWDGMHIVQMCPCGVWDDDLWDDE